MPSKPRKGPLRAVPDGEVPVRALSLLEAVDAGDYLGELRAMHRRIAATVSNAETPARDLAALSRRQMEISKEIRAIMAQVEGDEVGNAADTPDEEWSVS